MHSAARRNGVLHLLASVACLWASGSAAGQTALGPSFSYQGEITTAGGPLNGPVPMSLSLWRHATSTAVGDRIGGVQTVSPNPTLIDGRFTVTVNQGNEFGASAFTGSEERWLQVTVNGIAITPRTPIRAVPYAQGLRLPLSLTLSSPNQPILQILNTAPAQSSPNPAAAIEAVRTTPSTLYWDINTTHMISPAILGHSGTGEGVAGLSSAGSGVVGMSNAPNSPGVTAESISSGGIGLYARGNQVGAIVLSTGQNPGSIGLEASAVGPGARGVSVEATGEGAIGGIFESNSIGQPKAGFGILSTSLGDGSFGAHVSADGAGATGLSAAAQGAGAKGLSVELSGGATVGASIQGHLDVDIGERNEGNLNFGAIRFGGDGTGEAIASNRRSDSNGNRYGIDFWTGYQRSMSITNTGRVGIATPTPETALSVKGTAQIVTVPPGAGYGEITDQNLLAFGVIGDGRGSAENTDVMGFFRRDLVPNSSELCLVLGDDGPADGNSDYFSIGYMGASSFSRLFAFRTDGSASKIGGGSWAALSDPRAKTDVAPLRGTLDRLLSLRGYRFQYTDEAIQGGLGARGEQIGLMADEVERIFPDWVTRDKDGYRYVTERATTALMVEAFRDLRAEKDAVAAQARREIDALKAANADLLERLERLEKLVRTVKVENN